MPSVFPEIHLESGIKKTSAMLFVARHLTWLLFRDDLQYGDFFRIEAAIALYMVAVVEVSGSQIMGIWMIFVHSGS